MDSLKLLMIIGAWLWFGVCILVILCPTVLMLAYWVSTTIKVVRNLL